MNHETIKVGEIQFPPRKVFMKTYGCQMNEHDSQRLLSQLTSMNFTETLNKDDADLLLFNTCAIRDNANEKFYSHLGEIKHLKEKKQDIVVGVGGCIAQTEGKDLVKKYSHLDFAFGTDVIDQIGDMVYRTYAGENKFTVNTWDRSSDYSIETKITHGTPQAYVNIIKGCDKFCSYCIVPFTRGREKSRKQAEVVKDIKRLVEYQGIQEVTLLGQNVNSYGKENGESLAGLIRELDNINGLELIRYTTSHPYDVSDELIEVHGSSKKLAKHLHLPVQSGSNTVLQRMLREYTIEHYLGLLEKLRRAQPGIVLSSDIIVGFPNETDEEFEQTMELVRQAQYHFIFSYTFSPRAGTKAARMSDFLTDDVRGERLRRMNAMQLEIQKKLRKDMIGKTYRILVSDKNTMKGTTKWLGRTECMTIVHLNNVDPEVDMMWHWMEVKITSATALSTQGEMVRDLGKAAPSLLLQ
ncbi:MAG: tRNA (N6-isopentenyl adenosine(37)-C2)-methylthiotransferase MiaB [Bacteriovoracaceae bacterium]